MDIRIKHFDGQYPSFNVSLASSKEAEEFLTIKGCRIVSGGDGDFVSWPARKQESGKWWNHVWANEKFTEAVLREAQKSQPKKEARQKNTSDIDDDIPF